jgi:hypothetical protein
MFVKMMQLQITPVASLTLVPKAIPMQNISVVLANTLRERLSNPNAKLATDYADVIRVNMSASGRRYIARRLLKI